MNNEEAKDRLISLKLSYKIRIEEEDIEALDMGIEALENQKTGHWIDDSDGHGTSCSECGKWYPHSYLTKQDIIYCCKCGAKMDKENKE